MGSWGRGSRGLRRQAEYSPLLHIVGSTLHGMISSNRSSPQEVGTVEIPRCGGGEHVTEQWGHSFSEPVGNDGIKIRT